MKRDWTIVGITLLGLLFWLVVVRPAPVRKFIRAVETKVGWTLLPKPPAASKKKARRPAQKKPAAASPSDQPRP